MRCANEGVARPLGVGIDSMVSENQQTSAEIEELNESWRTVIFAHSSRSISFNLVPKLCMQILRLRCRFDIRLGNGYPKNQLDVGIERKMADLLDLSMRP